MEIANAKLLVEVLVDHNQHYSEPVRRRLLEGVFEMADACLRTIDARAEPAADASARRDLEIAANLIERHLISGTLTAGFLAAFDCFHRAAIEDAPRALLDQSRSVSE